MRDDELIRHLSSTRYLMILCVPLCSLTQKQLSCLFSVLRVPTHYISIPWHESCGLTDCCFPDLLSFSPCCTHSQSGSSTHAILTAVAIILHLILSHACVCCLCEHNVQEVTIEVRNR